MIRRLSGWAVAGALALAGCGAPPAPALTATPPPPSDTPTIFERTPATRDPLMGPPTLPPEFTRTPTFTPTATATETPTPTVTPTLTAQDVCALLAFPADELDGATYTTASPHLFVVGVPLEDARMTWTLTDLDGETTERLVFEPGQTALISPATLVVPGRWRWQVSVSTDIYDDICARAVQFTVVAPATPTPDAPPVLIDEILELIARRLRERLPTATPPAPDAD